MRAVNLLPRDEVRQSFGSASRRVAIGASTGFALVSIGLAALVLSAGGVVSSKQQTLDGLRADVAELQPDAATPVQDDSTLVTEKSARIGALASALAGRVAWDRVLREISLVLPGDVWLTSLQAKAPQTGTPATPAAPDTAAANGLVLSGSTYSQAGVARFLSRLAVVRSLTHVQLQSSTTTVIGKRSIVQFTVAAQVKAPGAAS